MAVYTPLRESAVFATTRTLAIRKTMLHAKIRPASKEYSMGLVRCAIPAGLSALILAGCGSLRGEGFLSDPALPDSVPTVATPRGALPAPTAKALMSRRWGANYLDVSAVAALEEQATSKPLIAGNKLILLYDGPQTMAAMIAAIKSATNHINLETYIFDQDVVGIQFAELLIAKQRAGVNVHVLYDAVGTVGTPEAFFQNMRDAGIQLQAFNPINPLKQNGQNAGWDPNHRDHRKILVVDGKVGFTGGVNISSTYANSSLFRSKSRASSKIGWRDTHVQIEGPAVASLQWEFLNTWFALNASTLVGSDFFPPLPKAGDTLVRVLASEPGGDQEIYRAHLLAIRSAKRSIHITCAYFVPDEQVRQALSEAALRGVEVRLVLPGVRESGPAFYAGRATYQRMLSDGVQIYELQIAVLHAKTAVIDGVWSTVGSANMDTRSFLHNSELNVMVFDLAFAAAMEDAFSEDLKSSKPVSLQQWSERPVAERIKEWLASRFGYWL